MVWAFPSFFLLFVCLFERVGSHQVKPCLDGGHRSLFFLRRKGLRVAAGVIALAKGQVLMCFHIGVCYFKYCSLVLEW